MAKKVVIYYVMNEQSNVSFVMPLPDIGPLNPPLGPKVPPPLKSEFMNRPPSDEDRATQRRAEQEREREEETNRGTARLSPALALGVAITKAARSADVVTGSGQLNVLRYGRVLKPRQLVAVRGAGLTYDGYYYVKSVTHNVKRGEYKQSFSLSRNALLPWTNTVPV
jgi:hypothetical protein